MTPLMVPPTSKFNLEALETRGINVGGLRRLRLSEVETAGDCARADHRRGLQ